VSPYAGQYSAKTTGQNLQQQLLTGSLSMTVSPDGSAIMVVYDAQANVLANLTAKLYGAGATFVDSTGLVTFYASFSPQAIVDFGAGNNVSCPVPVASGSWSNSNTNSTNAAYNHSSGTWSSQVPVTATFLTAAQASSMEAGGLAEGVSQLFSPSVASATYECQTGAANPLEPGVGTYAYTDSLGNTYSVEVSNETGTDSHSEPYTTIYVVFVAPSFNLDVVPSWPTTSVLLSSFNFFEVIPAIRSASNFDFKRR
jgi:hypothetical protein